MANMISALKRPTDNYRTTLNEVVNQVNESNSRDDRSIPGMIKTASSSDASTDLTAAKALIASLTSDLSCTTACQRRDDSGLGCGQFSSAGGQGNGKGGRGRRGSRPYGVLGVIDDTKDSHSPWTMVRQQINLITSVTVTHMITMCSLDTTANTVCGQRRDTKSRQL